MRAASSRLSECHFEGSKTADRGRRPCRSARSHGPIPASSGKVRRAASRRRRLMRLRVTAPPSFFVTVKPSRAGLPSLRSRICTTTPLAAKDSRLSSGEEILPLQDPVDRRYGAQCPRPLKRKAACGPATGGAQSPCGPPLSPCGRESHGGACGQAWRVEKCASQSFSIIGPPSGAQSMDRAAGPESAPESNFTRFRNAAGYMVKTQAKSTFEGQRTARGRQAIFLATTILPFRAFSLPPTPSPGVRCSHEAARFFSPMKKTPIPP